MDKENVVFVLVESIHEEIITSAYSTIDKAIEAMQQALDEDDEIQDILKTIGTGLTVEEYYEGKIDECGCSSGYRIDRLVIQ